MRDILTHTLVSLDLVEEIATLCQFHRDPSPDIVLAGLVEADDIVVTRNVSMHRYLQLQLSGADLAVARGVIFVDVLDGEDGVVRVQRAGFFDTNRVKTRQYYFPRDVGGHLTHQAYAPWPIVLETMRKGTSFGSGANCECCIVGSAWEGANE